RRRGREVGERLPGLEMDDRLPDRERLVLPEERVEEPPAVEDVLAAREVLVAIARERRRDRRGVRRRPAKAHAPEVAPGAAPEVVARVIGEEPPVLRRLHRPLDLL